MEAHNRNLGDWFTRIRTGQIKLPRFQRHEAWGHAEVTALIESVLSGLPTGATLVLAVGNEEQFLSRYLETAPEGTERVTEHLLDGQQRLTGLWRALHDNYEDRTYLVRWVNDPDHPGVRRPEVLSQARWRKRGTRFPVWVDDPKQTYERGYMPLRLLRPDSSEQEADSWMQNASGGATDALLALNRLLAEKRAALANYNIPYLSLPVTTPTDVALTVFVKMNTSMVRLSAFDIVVAQLEEATGQSLHDIVDELHAEVPSISRYTDPGTLLLDVAAMRADRTATQASYQMLDLKQVARDYDQIIDGIRWMSGFLEAERVFDRERLPSVAVLPVLAALHDVMPIPPDRLGNTRTLLRAYLWRAFLTPRYEQAAGARALQDLRGLRQAIVDNLPPSACPAPIFDEDQTPLPDSRELLGAGWPRTKSILARGILALSLRTGAVDIADGANVTAENISHREYHHLFPQSLLKTIGGLEDWESSKALNCALITWRTNRSVSNHSPMQYLRDRVDAASLGEAEIRRRFTTHLVQYEALADAGPYSDADSERLRSDYQRFLNSRIELLLPAIELLCTGRELPAG